MYIASDFKTYLNYCQEKGLKPCYYSSLESFKRFQNQQKLNILVKEKVYDI